MEDESRVDFVDAVLEADRKAPRKQRHTAHRIWKRIQRELPECKIGERTVRQYVHHRKIALGMLGRETCVPQSYAWSVEAQVDWCEAYGDLAGERVKLQVFAMRSMASGAAFHCAYLHATQQVFLETHELAFAYFGGLFRKVRYDNLTSAVKKILRGYQREETARFVAFRSHWRFEAEFCAPAEPRRKVASKGSRILSTQPLGAGASSSGYCRKEPAAFGGLPAGRTSLDRGTGAERRSEHGDRTRASFAFGYGRRRLGTNQLSDGEWSGLCESVDQHLLRAVAGGCAGASQSLRQHDRAVARGPMRGPT
jgi:hypothetical protein